jgi:hypothetical protein
MKKDIIEQFAEDIENLRKKVAKAKGEEKNKDKFTKKRNWKKFRATVNKEK